MRRMGERVEGDFLAFNQLAFCLNATLRFRCA